MVTQLTRLGLSIVAFSAMAAPLAGHAYLTPEQVFGEQSESFDRTDSTTHQAPPLQREGESVIQAQQRRAAEQRTAAQSSLRPVDAEPQDTYVPENTNDSRGLFDQDAQYEKRLERKAASDTGGPTIIIGADGGTVIDANGNILHSGAPKMSGTGPESVLAAAAVILATISTFAYARIRARTLAVA